MFVGRRKITLENKIDHVLAMKNTGVRGLEEDPAGLRTGNNSGYQAINLAYHFGAKQIYLLGYDMKVSTMTHWNHRPEYQPLNAFQQTLQQMMLPNFPSLKAPLDAAGVSVINCTPGSALKVWPSQSLDSVIKGLRHA